MSTEETEQIAANLDAAREALRAADPEPLAVPEPEPAAPDPVFPSLTPVLSPAEPGEPEPKSGPTIITETGELPNDLARGRSTREYPPLRGALVKLAHDDPAAAGRLLAGFLKAQHAALTELPPDYDLTIAEVGTFAVSQAGQTTLVSPIEAPRGRGQAAFHLTVDALTLAESVSGVATKARRRRGPIRVSGKARHARRLTENLRQDVSLKELVAAGADLDPHLTLRALSYAVRPAWTQGQRWRVELVLDGAVLAVAANHTGGLTISEGPGDEEADARLLLTAAEFRALAAGDLAEPRAEGDERVVRRLLTLAERARTGAE